MTGQYQAIEEALSTTIILKELKVSAVNLSGARPVNARR